MVAPTLRAAAAAAAVVLTVVTVGWEVPVMPVMVRVLLVAAVVGAAR